MFTFSEMLALVQSESSFGAFVFHRRPAGLQTTSDLVRCPTFPLSQLICAEPIKVRLWVLLSRLTLLHGQTLSNVFKCMAAKIPSAWAGMNRTVESIINIRPSRVNSDLRNCLAGKTGRSCENCKNSPKNELILKTIGNRKGSCAWSCSRWQTQPEKICKSQRTNQCHSLCTLYWFVLCNLQIFSGCVCHLEQLHTQSPFLFPIVF